MGSFKDLVKEPSFYLKIIELALCIVGTVFYILFPESFKQINVSTRITVAIALPNYIIVVSVLLIMLILEEDAHVTEMCLQCCGGILNLVVGVLLLCLIGGDNSTIFFVLMGVAIGNGVVMILDTIREVKGK